MITSFAIYSVDAYPTKLVDERGTQVAAEGEVPTTFSGCFVVPTTTRMDRSYTGNMESWDYDVYIPGLVTQDVYSFTVEGVAGFPAGETVKMWVTKPGRHFVSPTGSIDYTIYGVSLRKG